MGLHKILKIVALILSLIGIVLLAMVLLENYEVLSSYIIVAYITLGIAIFFTLLFSFTQLFTNKEVLKRTLISVGLFILIIAISYVLAEGNVIEKKGVEIVSETGSRWVGTGLITFYFLAVIAIGLMILSGIQKLVKN